MKKIITIGIIVMFSCMALIPLGKSIEVSVPTNDTDICCRKGTIRITGAIRESESTSEYYKLFGNVYSNIVVNGRITGANQITFTPWIRALLGLSPGGDIGAYSPEENMKLPCEVKLEIGFFIGKIDTEQGDGKIDFNGQAFNVMLFGTKK